MKKTEYFALTDEVIEREMTAEELAEREAGIAQWLGQQEVKAQAEAEAKAKRQALLDRLGITEEEARLLLGGI